MKYSWIIRLVGAVFLLAGIAAVGYLAYTAGLAHGQTVTVDADAVAAGQVPWGWRPVHGSAFFPALLCLAPFFLCMFIFLPLRMVFGPHHPRMHRHGMWHGYCREEKVPSPVAEWHRRLHEDETTST